MPPFDAKAWIAAHEPPIYIDRAGTTHTGRLWSHVEYLKIVKTFFQVWEDRRAKGEQVSDVQYESELRQVLASMDFTPAVVEEMMALPSVALEQMTKGFFTLQRAGREKPPSTPEPQIPSSPSPPTAPVSAPSAS